MRFTQRLYIEGVPEWMDCYINYKHLKKIVKILKSCVSQRQQIDFYINQKKVLQLSNSNSNQALNLTYNYAKGHIQQYYQRYGKLGEQMNSLFIAVIEKEINLFVTFVNLKYKEVNHRFQKSHIFFHLHAINNENLKQNILMPYVEYLFIQAYILSLMISSNIEAQRKILQKHSLYSSNHFKTPKQSIPERVKKEEFDNMFRIIQKFYMRQVSTRSDSQDRFRLRQLATAKKNRPEQLLVVGTLFGFFLGSAIFLYILIERANGTLEKDPVFNRDFPVWRGVIFTIFYIWMIGIDIYFYEKFNVNHRSVLQNNYTYYPTSSRIIGFSSFFTVVFIVLFSLYALKISSIINLAGFTPQLLPVFIWGAFVLYIINPISLFFYKSRGYTFKLLLKILVSFFIPLTFPIIWGTDQLVSLFVPFQDIVYTCCYYSKFQIPFDTDYTVYSACLPSAQLATFIFSIVVYCYRIIQCLKIGFCSQTYWKKSQFYNCFKYGLSLITAVLSFQWKKTNSMSILPAWIVFAVVTTLFTFAWDLKNDWDLLHFDSQNFMLRDRITYSKFIYYICIVVNFILRCTWVLYISPNISKNLLGSVELFILLFAMLQILRRGIWNLFRLQVQHVRNCKVLRALPKQYERLDATIDNHLKTTKQKIHQFSEQRIIYRNFNSEYISQNSKNFKQSQDEIKGIIEKQKQNEKNRRKQLAKLKEENQGILQFLVYNLYQRQIFNNRKLGIFGQPG